MVWSMMVDVVVDVVEGAAQSTEPSAQLRSCKGAGVVEVEHCTVVVEVVLLGSHCSLDGINARER